VPFFDDLVTLDRPVIEDGYVTLPDGPGIGAELDLDACRRYARPDEPFFDRQES
jgi:galactonate dehydratase